MSISLRGHLSGARPGRGPWNPSTSLLKRLLQHDPAAFIGFGLGDTPFRILEPVPSVLPARGRDIDAAYLVDVGGAPEGAEPPEAHRRLVHIELHRRHQSQKELGVDITEAQARLFRREGRLVVSHLWDLYGDADAPVREERRFTFGADGSTCVYQRINLRGMSSGELLAEAPPALWALVALTRDGAAGPVIERARDAIEQRSAWAPAERADHLAVLWFVAEAEGVPGDLMRAVVSEERLMEGDLYREIFGEGKAEGEAKGKAEGKTQGKAEGILAVLDARGIPVSATIRARILGCKDPATLDVWIRRAAVTSTAAAVVRAKATPRTGASGAARHAKT